MVMEAGPWVQGLQIQIAGQLLNPICGPYGDKG